MCVSRAHPQIPMKRNLESQRIARTEHARVEVTAGAGSGKTTTLVARCNHLISKGQEPTRILFVSFSNDAVGNLRNRLNAIEGGADIRVQTCHALALDIIGSNLALAGLKSKPEVLSPSARLKCIGGAVAAAVKTLIGEAQDAVGRVKQALKSEVTWLKEQQVSASLRLFAQLFDYASATGQPLTRLLTGRQCHQFQGHLVAVKAVRAAYRKVKKKAGGIDYADFMALAVKVLESGKKVRGVKFDHLLVDEYQDTSPAQSRMFVALAARVPGLMVVGDPRQAIYGFGGARYTPLGSLLAGVENMPLSRSYRLPQTHADLSTAIAGSRVADAPAVVGHAGGKKPVLLTASSEIEQARMVASRIRGLLRRGVLPQEIVVLARLRDLLKPIQMQLLSASIACVAEGKPPGLQHVRATLKLVEYVDGTQLKDLSADGLASVLDADLPNDVLRRVLKTVREATRSHTFEGRFTVCARAYMLANGGIRKDLECRKVLTAWATRCRTLNGVAEALAAVNALDGQVAIETSTIHAAKGREWKHVFLIGATDGVLPDWRADTDAKLAEERNVMYVAVTRASETLTISFAPATFVANGRVVKKTKLSRFLTGPVKRGMLE